MVDGPPPLVCKAANYLDSIGWFVGTAGLRSKRRRRREWGKGHLRMKYHGAAKNNNEINRTKKKRTEKKGGKKRRRKRPLTKFHRRLQDPHDGGPFFGRGRGSNISIRMP